jgi:hypothetical protein
MLDKANEMFQGQKEFIEDYQLENANGQPSGTLHCSLLWIYSKVKLFQDYKEEISATLSQIEKDKEKFVVLSNLLKKAPFIKDSSGINVQVFDVTSLKEKVSQFIDEQTTAIAAKLYPNMTPRWEDICFYTILGYMALSTCIMMYRPDFINVKF